MSWKEQLNRIAQNTEGLSRSRRNAAIWMFALVIALIALCYFACPFRSDDTLLVVAYEGSRSLFLAEEVANPLTLEESPQVDYLFAGSPHTGSYSSRRNDR